MLSNEIFRIGDFLITEFFVKLSSFLSGIKSIFEGIDENLSFTKTAELVPVPNGKKIAIKTSLKNVPFSQKYIISCHWTLNHLF
jgi:hypothetical protein